MSEQILQILLLDDDSMAFSQPLSDILKEGGLNAHVEQVTTLSAFRAAFKSAKWDAVVSAYSVSRETLLAVEEQLPFVVLCEAHEQDDAFALTEPGISDVLPVTHLQRLPFILRRELNLNALQAGALRYQRTLDNMLEGFQIVGFDWRYLYVNDAAASHGRRAKEELLGHTIMESYPGIETTEIFAVLRQCMEERTSRQIENLFAYPQGGEAWFELNIQPVPEGISVLSVDITERKRTENALFKSEEMLRLFIEHAPAAIAMFDQDMRYLAVSQRWLTDYRLGEQDIIGRSHYDVFPDIPQRWRDIHQRCLNGAIEKSEADPFPRTDGTLDWVRWEIHPWQGIHGEIGGIVLFSEVITEQKRSEDRIRKLNRTLAVLSDINQAIVRIRSMPTLFDEACQIAVEKGGFRIAWIGLLDKTSRRVNVIAAAGEAADSLAEYKLVLSGDMVGRSVGARRLRTGAHVICNDITHDSHTTRWRGDALRLGCRASAVFPLKVAGEVRGVIGLYAGETDFFDDAELRLLDEMAGDISFALEFAEQEEQRQQAEAAVRQYARRMEILHQIDLGLIQGDSIEALVESTLKHIREIIPCQAASVAVFDQTPGEVFVFALNLQNPSALVKNVRIPVQPGWLEQFGTGTQLVIDDLRLLEDPTPTQQRLIAAGLFSALYNLLPGQGQLLGSFSLAAETVGLFTPDYQEIAGEVANQLAIAIRQMHLTEELAQHATLLEQRVAERTHELQMAKERVEAILNSNPDGILLLRADLLIEQTNPAFNGLFACEADDYLYRPLFDLVHPDDVNYVKEAVQAGFADGIDQCVDIRACRKNGTYFDAELSIGFIAGDGLVCSFRDVTERRAQERQLRYHASLQENVSDAVIVTDMDLHIQSWNKAAERIYGWSEPEVLGRVSSDVVRSEFSSPDERQQVIEKIQAGSWWQAEVVQRRKDGSRVNILGSVTVVHDENGRPLGIVAVNRDITGRKQAESALQQSAAEIHDLYNNAPCGYHSLDKDGVIVQINDTELRWLGYTREEVVGKLKIADIFTPDSIETFRKNFPGFKERGWVNDLEFDLVCKDSRLIHILLNGTAIYDEQGQYVKSRSSVFDITALKQAEQALNVKFEEERAFQAYLKALHEITVELAQIDQLDEFYKRVVEAGLQRLGLDRMSMFLHDVEQGAAVGTYGTDPQGNLVDERHLRFVAAPDGIMGRAFTREERIYLDEHVPLTGSHEERLGYGWNAAAVLWNGTERLGWLVADNLLSHKPASKPMLEALSLYGLTVGTLLVRKRAEAALRESEERFRHVVEAAPDYVLMYDTNGVIQMVNPAALRDSGYAQHEMIGHNMAEFFPPEARPLFEQELLHTLETGSHHDEEHFVRKDGSIVVVDCSGSVIAGEDGQPQSVMVLKRDITQRKQAEDALRQALAKEKELNELKSRFVSMASHEFRTPLATILAATETLTAYRHRLTDEQVGQRLNKITEQVGYLKDIMEDVLLLAKMQARRVEFTPVSLDLDALCRSVLDEFQSRPDVKHQLVYTYDEAIGEVRLDRKLIRQIISNIVHNAIKYSPVERPVTVRLENTPEAVVLTVRDEGIGIPEADQKHLFEPFHRAANVGTISGTGLGLVIVKESVELHGGTIFVESQVGVGTTFTVSLPTPTGGESDDDKHSGN